jgi:hypothetical protein
MGMKCEFWIKFSNCPPELWRANNFEELWYRIREHSFKGYYLEWMIQY